MQFSENNFHQWIESIVQTFDTLKMKIILCLLLTSITFAGISQEEQSPQGNGINTVVSISLNSNGLAPIPAFSLGKPAIISSVNIAKGRFSYDPVLAYSLEMKPWFIDNWLHYKIVRKPKFELKAGANFSTFCSGLNVDGEEILKAERYFAFSISPTYKFSPVSSLTFDLWSDNGQEKGSISGYYLSLAFDRSEISIGDNLLFSANLMLFQLLYDGSNDGLFFSPSFSLSMRNTPAALFFQATQSIQSNIPDLQSFRWNIGIRYNIL